MSKEQKIVLIGAGSLQFGLGSVGSIINSDILSGSTISLHDIDAKSLKIVEKACKSAIEEKELDFKLESTTEREEALNDATFIINSIEVAPRFDLWDQDLHVPHWFGNKQVFGENGGPGGLFHSLRIIPPILEICEDVSRICPNAFFINFSNPMSRICLAIKRKFPNIKLIGLCHELGHFKIHYAKMLDTELSNLDIVAGGLNHFGVVLEIKYKDTGKDAYPDIRSKGPKYLSNLKNLDVDLNRYILEKYGYIPYTTDSHFGEYIHWAWESADISGVKEFRDTYMTMIDYESKKITRLIKRGKGSRLVKPDVERAVPIIEGILDDSHHTELSVNIPNQQIITNLPEDLIVECPAIVTKNGLEGLRLGDYPKGLAALLRNQASVQDLVVETVLTQSKEIALQALLADPVVFSFSQAEKILDEFMKIQSQYITLK
ncbi:MAG: alpha-glucosidase [Candidatus Lokiarchaeota archaeon]|nr:alpha-glucosidase [Candidatus Lokiarchaeota archaeon]MBD3199818.1 alpha-glucosidase [Candidatus Lokiarchaeota archaeon]